MKHLKIFLNTFVFMMASLVGGLVVIGLVFTGFFMAVDFLMNLLETYTKFHTETCMAISLTGMLILTISLGTALACVFEKELKRL